MSGIDAIALDFSHMNIYTLHCYVLLSACYNEYFTCSNIKASLLK